MSDQGHIQEFVSEGTIRVGSVTSGAQSPGLGLGQSPRNPKIMLKISLNVKNSIPFREKNFSVAISEWDMSHLPPLPYAPVSGRSIGRYRV